MIYSNRYYSGSGRRQQGFSLMEALVAFVILAGGLMVLFRFHTTSVQSTADSKIRAEAIALGEAKLEEVRSFLSQAQYNTRMVANDGSNSATSLGDYASGVDFAASFTRAWTTDMSTSPGAIAVTVSWVDRAAVADADGVIPTQSIALTSRILGGEPNADAQLLQVALTGSYNPGGEFEPEDPTTKGTGAGTGGVLVGKVYDADGNPLVGYPQEGVNYYYDIAFTGSIAATDQGLTAVTLAGGVHSTASCTILGTVGTAIPEVVEGQFDVNGNPVFIWRDAEGNEVPPPYRYECKITRIPDDTVWQGTITYKSGTSNVVCIPSGGSTAVAFSENSPPNLQLGIVVVAKKGGGCNTL